MGIWGPSITPISPSPGSHFGGDPPPIVITSNSNDLNEDPLVTWARNTCGVLKRERQEVTTRMTEAINLMRGGSDNVWKDRESWKIETKLNYCYTIPAKWASILSDNEMSLIYSSKRDTIQKQARILSAAFSQAYTDYGWQRVIRNAVFDSRVQIKSYLSLRPDIFDKNPNKAHLFVIPGLQVYVDRNATCIDDAEIIMWEHRESYGKVVARFPDVEEYLERKYQNLYDPHNINPQGKIATNAATLDMPTGQVINNPPYAGAPNPPDEAGGTSGILVREFWTRSYRKVQVEVPLFTASGEPACVPKEIEYADGTTELLRRIVTEGNVVYELPQSIVDLLHSVSDYGGIRILQDDDAWEVLTHKVDTPLYPDGRLLVVVDENIIPDEGDKLNPLGYMPFIEIESHPESSSFYGMGDIDLIKGAYTAMLKLAGVLVDNGLLTANSIWRIPEDSILSNDDITNAPGSIQREDAITLKYGKREPAPEMPQYVFNLLKFFEEKMYDLSGLTPAALGKTNPKAQQSTDTTLMQQEQSSVEFRDAQRSLKRAYTILGQQFQEFVERWYQAPELVEIKNDLGQKEAVPLIGSRLTENYHVEAKPGSMMSSTPTARLTTGMNLIQSGLVDLPYIWGLLEEVGSIPSAKEMERRITQERSNPLTRWLVPGADPKPQKGSAKKPNSKNAKKGPALGAG